MDNTSYRRRRGSRGRQLGPCGRLALGVVAFGAAGGAALGCSGDGAPAGPRATVGPEALALRLVAIPETVAVGEPIRLRATAYNRGAGVAVARYQPGACGLRVALETEAGRADVSFATGCRGGPGGVASDTLAPGDSLVLDGSFAVDAPGTFRARAGFEAANGSAPRIPPVVVVVSARGR